MDPLFMSFSQVNGVPQESKLATYMVSCIVIHNLHNYIQNKC